MPVRQRLRWRCVMSRMVTGAICGGACCAVLGAIRVCFGLASETVLPFALIGIATVLGGLAGYFTRRTWHEAAATVDRTCGLKDRTVSALEFSAGPASPHFELQLQDALHHLTSVDARRVVPSLVPRHLGWAGLTAVVGVAAMLLQVGGGTVEASVVRSAGVAEAAAEIRAEIEQMEELAEQASIRELTSLVMDLKTSLTQLEAADTDVRKSLSTISDMQQKMQTLMSELNVAAMDAQLSEVAEAMEGAAAFKPASDALKKDSLEQAASALENVAADTIDRSESRAAGEDLAEAAAAAKEKSLNQLSETLDQLSESVKARDAEGVQRSSEQLAEQVRRHDLSKKMSNMLNSKVDKLGMAKKLAAANSNSEGNGAAADATGTNLTQGESKQKSNASSRKAGAKSAGNIDGEKTKREGQLQMARLTGQMGQEGDSDFETITSTEGQAQAERLAREAFAKYQKLSEAVLESEPVPLGHRETIRRYFELIRPDTAEGADILAKDAAGNE